MNKAQILRNIAIAKEARKPRMAGDALSQAADDIIGELRDEAAYEEIQGLKDTLGALYQRKASVDARWDRALELAGLDKSHLHHASNVNETNIIQCNLPDGSPMGYITQSNIIQCIFHPMGPREPPRRPANVYRRR